MYEFLDYIVNNKWITFLFGGAGVTFFILIYNKYFSKSSISRSEGQVTNNIVIHNGAAPLPSMGGENKMSDFDKLQNLKNKIKILFIDDNEFPLVEICKHDGWRFTKLINDAQSINIPEIIEADIVFVDIHGVGISMNFKNQGLGLAVAIKKEFPNKIVIIYSANSSGDIFSEDWKIIDDRIPKDADPYLFLEKIKSYAQKMSK